MKEKIISIPEGSTDINVKIDGDIYPLTLEFNNDGNMIHYFLENGKYDGYDHACKTKKEDK